MKSNTKFKLPFVYQLHDEPTNDSTIPNTLDFEVEYDASLGLIQQKYSSVTDQYLSEAYKLGSVIGGNTLEDEIGDNYTNGVLDYMNSVLHSEDYAGKRILEVGCGIGYLLSKLKEKKADVLGIEPGIQGQMGAKKYNIPVIQGFYPEVEVEGKFDIIVSYCVLEHVTNPLLFLQELKPLLKPDGKVFIIVPNEEPYLEVGDISTLFHEHWSYFTNDALKNLIVKSGGHDIDVVSSDYGGLLYANFSFDDGNGTMHSLEEEDSFYTNFLENIEVNSKRIKTYFDQHNDVGVYVPLRIVNYLVHYDIDMEKVRFFDDDAYSYNKYFPGLNIKIENFEDFKRNPPAHVLVMSNFFEQVIKDKIGNNIDANIDIVVWSDIFKTV